VQKYAGLEVSVAGGVQTKREPGAKLIFYDVVSLVNLSDCHRA